MNKTRWIELDEQNKMNKLDEQIRWTKLEEQKNMSYTRWGKLDKQR